MSLLNHSGGAEEAEVEVELYRQQEPNILVATTIAKHRQPTQSWRIDGRPADRAELTAITRQLQIQPGNLCQFLPQDVVR